ncbi:hypothetical protein WICMUC_002468, partial [Wickerhamomyces mucosus]
APVRAGTSLPPTLWLSLHKPLTTRRTPRLPILTPMISTATVATMLLLLQRLRRLRKPRWRKKRESRRIHCIRKKKSQRTTIVLSSS